MFEKILRNKAILAAVAILFGIYMIFAGRSVLDTIVRVGGYVLLGTAFAYLLSFFLGADREQVRLG